MLCHVMLCYVCISILTKWCCRPLRALTSRNQRDRHSGLLRTTFGNFWPLELLPPARETTSAANLTNVSGNLSMLLAKLPNVSAKMATLLAKMPNVSANLPTLLAELADPAGYCEVCRRPFGKLRSSLRDPASEPSKLLNASAHAQCLC